MPRSSWTLFAALAGLLMIVAVAATCAATASTPPTGKLLVPVAGPGAGATATPAPMTLSAAADRFAPVITAPPEATVVPVITVEPASGGDQTPVQVTGSGFPANTHIGVHLGGPDAGATHETYSEVDTDAGGSFSTDFMMPGQWPNGQPITTQQLVIVAANDDYTARATANFNYQAATTAARQAGATAGGEATVAWQQLTVLEADVTFDFPSAWQRQGLEWTWAQPGGAGRRVGLNWNAIGPGWQETGMLPNHAQTLQMQAIDLGWIGGTLYTVTQQGSAAQGGGAQSALAQTAELHLIVRVDGKRAYDFFASAGSIKDLATLEPLIEHMARSAKVG